MSECNHKWVYQSVVYTYGRQLPGSSAHDRVYYDRYYCERCLAVEDRNERVIGDTYQQPFEGTFPK